MNFTAKAMLFLASDDAALITGVATRGKGEPASTGDRRRKEALAAPASVRPPSDPRHRLNGYL